jgi:hypothetical protein
MHGQYHDGSEEDEQCICALFECVHEEILEVLNLFGANMGFFYKAHQM